MADLVRWNPFNELTTIRDEVNRLFADSFARVAGDGFIPAYRNWQPAVDVAETDTDLIVTAELPGLSQDDIDVSILRDTLTISGKMNEEKETRNQNYLRRERRWGAFQRTITLPAPVNPEGATASFRNGLLEVRLPKTEDARPRPIRIDVQ